MSLSRLNGWTLRYIMWGVSQKALMSMLGTIKAPQATKKKETVESALGIPEAPSPSEAARKLQKVGIKVVDRRGA